MRVEDFVKAVRERLQATGHSRHSAAVSHDLPRDAIRRALEGHMPRLDRAAEICAALGLEFYIGPPRAEPQTPGRSGLSPASLPDLESSAHTLNRVVVDAGGDPIPDDLWPVLAARRGVALPLTRLEDTDRLQLVIEAVELGLANRGVNLAPATKAKVLAMAYAIAGESDAVDIQRVLRLVEAA